MGDEECNLSLAILFYSWAAITLASVFCQFRVFWGKLPLVGMAEGIESVLTATVKHGIYLAAAACITINEPFVLLYLNRTNYLPDSFLIFFLLHPFAVDGNLCSLTTSWNFSFYSISWQKFWFCLFFLTYRILTSPKETIFNITKILLIKSAITCRKSQFSSGHLAFSLLEIGHVGLASEVHEHFFKKINSSGFYSYICNH